MRDKVPVGELMVQIHAEHGAALDDAPDVEVKIRFSDATLELAVSGPARRRSKAAIDRARERVQLHRGTLEATTHDGRAEAVASLRRRQGWSAVGQPETTTSTNPSTPCASRASRVSSVASSASASAT